MAGTHRILQFRPALTPTAVSLLRDLGLRLVGFQSYALLSVVHSAATDELCAYLDYTRKELPGRMEGAPGAR